MRKVYVLLFAFLSFKNVYSQSFADPNFTAIPISSGWVSPVGARFSPDGQKLFVWERAGKLYVCNRDGSGNYVKQAMPVADISEEVADWDAHGMIGFAMDPNFQSNGLIYLLYVVDRHHLLNYGTGSYNPNTTIVGEATIGRVTRYQTQTSSGNLVINPASRAILIGETKSTGMPILHHSHGVGTLAFAADGTLLVTIGDAASYEGTDAGSYSGTFYAQALADGIIRPAENVGAFRAQMINSMSGKLLRIDPQTGNGVPSNPFYDPSQPRAPKSRVWALGIRNSFRIFIKPGTGSTDPAAGDIGEVFLGDVGFASWEEMNICKAPGTNFGWPIYEGNEYTIPLSGVGGITYKDLNVVNQDEPNPLYGTGGCNQQYFYFRELIKQVNTDDDKTIYNPCNGSVVLGSGNRYYHKRPTLEWSHAHQWARVGIFNGTTPDVALIGSPESGVVGTPFAGQCSVGGTLYTGNTFPSAYQNTYFQADFGNGWIKRVTLDNSNEVTRVDNFASGYTEVVCITQNPIDGSLVTVQINSSTGVKRVQYGGNQPPVAKPTANKIYGQSPLTVNFNGSNSYDPNSGGSIVSYSWNFGGGSPATSAVANPGNIVFTESSGNPRKFVVKLTVTDNGGATHTDSVIISVNNTPPVVNITSPVNNSYYNPGPDTLYACTANVSDAQHSSSQLTYEWQTTLRHNDHEHRNPIDNEVNTNTLIQRIGFIGTDTYYWLVQLTVTDAAGLSTTDSVKIYPNNSAGDIAPPVISSVSPLAGSTGVSTGTIVSAMFNEVIDPSTVTGTTFQLKDAANNIVNATVNASSAEIILTPTSALTTSTVYTATIKGGALGIKDLSGNVLESDYTWSFTTGSSASQPLMIQSLNTKSGTSASVHSLTGVPPGALLVLATTADALPGDCIVSSTPALTWTKRSDAGASQSDNAEIWTAVYTAGGSITVTSNWGTDNSQSSVCYVVLNAESTLGGASAIATLQASPSVAITTTRENSIIFGCTADWKAVNGATRTLRDGATERLYYRDVHYTTYHYTKATTTIGSYTEGVSVPTGQQASTALLEIRSAVSTPDVTPPTVASVLPANGTTGVNPGVNITADFSEVLNTSTVTTTTFQLRDAANNLISASVTASGNQITLDPSITLTGSTVYTVTITGGASGVKDVAGNALVTNYTWSFTTAAVDNTAPTVTSVSPANGATGVTTVGSILANFSEAVNTSTVTITTFQLRDAGNNLIPATVSTLGSQITLTPTSSLAGSATFTVTITGGASGVKDMAGNALASNYSWSFTTAAVTSQPLTIQSFDTKSGAAATAHSLTGIPAGALLVLATTADALPGDCIVSSVPALTWTKRSDAGASQSDNAEIWTAVYTAGGSITVTSNWGTDNSQSSVCYVVLNAESTLGGASAIATLQASPSVTITTTRENSIIFGCTADWRTINGATRTLRDAATERLYFRDAHYTTYHYTKAAAAIAAYTLGVSAPTGQQASTALLEIRSNAVTTIAPTITTQPASQTKCAGESISFTSAANGTPAPTVQWQESSNGTTWTNIAGATNAILSFTTTAADNNKQYRAVWTSSAGTANSNAAILTVNAIPATPGVTVTNNCGNSLLTATGTTGSLLWSNGATTSSITVTTATTYTVTQTVNVCTSAAGSGTAAPKPTPSLTSSLTGTIASGSLFNYTATSNTAGTSFAWSRAAVAGISNAATNGTGNISETLTNTTSSPVNVTYVYTLNANGCINTQNVVVTVNAATTGNCTINNTSLTTNFNATAIPAGRYIWFNSSFDPGPLPSGTDPVTINITNGVISFTANNVQYNLNVPNSRIRFDASVTSASTQFINNVWESVVPRSYSSDVFMSGLSYLVPVNFPGNYMSVKWTMDISIDKPGISIGWRWAAAVYTSFADNAGLNVKPINGTTMNPYANSDRAGSPQNFKSFVVNGAKGTGGTNYTGSYTSVNTATCTTNSGQRPSQQPIVRVLPVLNDKLEIEAMPNPSTTWFNLSIAGNNKKPVTIKVTDIFGRVMERYEKISANTILKIGSKLPGGSYYVEIVQGEERKIVKITKAN